MKNRLKLCRAMAAKTKISEPLMTADPNIFENELTSSSHIALLKFARA